MNRANPADLRKALEVSRAMVDAGIDFVPVPVTNATEKEETAALAAARLESIEQQATKTGD